MTVQLAPTPFQKFFDNNGAPLAFGLLYSYVAGTTNPQATYTDATQTTQNTNPVVLNARGEASVWLDNSLAYKLVLKDQFNNQIWSQDQINASVLPISYGLGLPSNTAMGNGAPYLSGAQLGTAGSPTTNAAPLLSFAKYSSAGAGPNGYEGGVIWASLYRESGTAAAVSITAYTQVDGGTADAVAMHAFGQASNGTTCKIFSGWFTTHDNNTVVQSQAFGAEIDLVLAAGRTRVTNVIGANAAVGLWINNQSDEIGSYHATFALGIASESNAGGLGFTSQWYTGIFVQQNAIVPGGANEAIQLNGGDSSAHAYTGIRLIGQFVSGLDLSGGFYSGTAAPVLLPNGNGISSVNGAGNAAYTMMYANSGNVLVLGQNMTSAQFQVPLGVNGRGAPPQVTGWGTPTGTGVVSNFPGASATLAQTSQAVAQIITDMKNIGFYGA